MQQQTFTRQIQPAWDSSTVPQPVLPQVPPTCASLYTRGILQDKIRQTQESSQAPLPLAMLSGLAVSSFLVQRLALVEVPNGRTVPMSLFCLSIAESGERKSAVLNEFLQPLEEFLETKQEQARKDWQHYQRDMEIWTARRKRLVAAIAKSELDESEETGHDL